MYPYQKPQMDLLFDLIKEANPGIEFPFNPSTMKVGTPAAQTVPSGGIADTNVVITPRTNDHWFGTVKVQYRRLGLDRIFKNMTPVPLEYYSASPSSTTGVFVEKLNKIYGTSFLPNDFNWPPGTALSSNSPFSLTPVAGNLCYSPAGGAQFIWRPVKPILNEVSVNGTLTGRTYPGGNDFVTPGRKPQGEYLAYSVNNTSSVLTGTNYGSGTITNTAQWQQMVLPLKAADSRFSTANSATVDGGLNGLAYVTYTLPHALVPEANSALYKFAIVVVPLPNSWFQGRLILHYN